MILSYQKYLFTIAAKDEIHLPGYKGSTFRGGFGNAFKRVVCALKKNDCVDCLLKVRCPYAYIFETFPRPETSILNMHTYEKVPHPFVIEPPPEAETVYEPGRELSFSLILVGRANEYLPYFVYAFEELGKMGIGKGRGRYTLTQIMGCSETIYDAETRTLRQGKAAGLSVMENEESVSDERVSELKISFLTPLRVVHQRKLVSDLAFSVLITALLRRILLLGYFHSDQGGEAWDHKGIIARASQIVRTKNELTWRDWERYSGRQQTRMKMGGLVGDVAYRGEIESFRSLLEAGEILHVGKGTSFGLGKYRLHKAEMQDICTTR